MTEQELRESLISVAPSAIYANESEIVAIVEIAKAYADARESKEIAELKATNNLSSIGWRKDCEARDLKIDQLNAEIKRLREFAQQCHKSPEKLVLIHYFENGEFDYCDLVPLQDAAINSLSPAPVTEQCPDILQTILNLPDDTSAAYIKSMIHDQLKIA